MSNLYTGEINTQGEYVNLAQIAGITFTQDTTYAFQIQNAAWLREGTEGKGFLFNKDKGYNWTCKGDDLYIRTTLSPAIVNIAENSGFFLNKSSGGGGGSTIKNTADLLIDEVNRNIIEEEVPSELFYIENWTQPILTENGIMGGDTFAVSTNVPMLGDSQVYYAFDGSTGGGLFHSTQSAVLGYIDIYNPEPLCITNIQTTNQAFANRASSRGIIYASNDGTNWQQLTTYTNSVQSSEGVWNISVPNNINYPTNYYKYYRLESTQGGGNGYWVIAEINLTATVRRVIQ